MKETKEILIVDLEATCWRTKELSDKNQSEIIEIGFALVDVNGDSGIVKAGSYLVRPVRSSISEFCTELTTITQEMVDKDGISLSEAGQRLKPYRNLLWGSWGDYDRNMMNRSFRAADVHMPLSNRHINIKAMFSILTQQKQEVGMEVALKELGIPMEGTHHRGGDDAKAIAKIFCKLQDLVKKGREK